MMKTLFTIAALLISVPSFAQIQTGYFSGFVNNNPFQELCRLDRADVEFIDQSNGQYDVRWKEEGMAQQPGSGFCENNFDATFFPTGKTNEWNVTFNFNWDLVFGTAVLQNNILTINANYSGSNRAFLRFSARMQFNASQNSMNYNRTIDRWSGSPLYANGVLRK
jgi:hypothetical protein